MNANYEHGEIKVTGKCSHIPDNLLSREDICSQPNNEEEIRKDVLVQTSSILSSYFTEEAMSEDPFDSVCSSGSTEMIRKPESTEKHVPKYSQLESKQDITSLNHLRQRDAWLPSESTQKSLTSRNPNTKSVAIKPVLMGKGFEISGSGSNFVCDPFRHLLTQYVGDELNINAIRQAPSDELGGQSVDDLKKIIANGWYTYALNLTYRILSTAGFREGGTGAVLTPYTAQIWLCRLVLLVRTRNYELAEREFSTFQDMEAPNFYFEYDPKTYPGRTGSIIPFSLRLLHAELPFHSNRANEALDRLYYLLAVINRIISNLKQGFKEDGLKSEPDLLYRQASLNLWTSRKIRVLSGCLSIFLHILDFRSALNTVHQLARLCSDNHFVLRGFCSLLGRIYLQFGDLEMAKAYFSRSLSNKNLLFSDKPQLVRKNFHNALLSIGKGEYIEAEKFFRAVLQIDPTNVAAANNLAICALFLGQLSESVEALEDLTTTGLTNQQLNIVDCNTTATTTTEFSKFFMFNIQRRRFCLHDVMVSNLAVLYEVESNSATVKKLNLLKNMVRIPGEPVHMSSFKLTMKQ
ncbi:Trafficking protein particle complex subunit 12 isoform 3 [Schistosoma japonicum]|uniref:Tetratricopeptide repeat protein 15 n=2 Tax=Schistosoma japonicum TaxID=6182 RepID=C1LE37_SCHJA|nr:Trafficking protein particle complex subunit 12 [Schistosoma japonicum]TNN05273.1 Trafficking protein particle complex subunit 12 isoform 3 [Schistosoma japonicum]CAX72965.1 Tetratricopeptide repeat protein 15 [Schistosoma japonicum]